MEQFFAVRRFSSALAFSADGSQLLFASNLSGQFNLWRVPIEGGWPDQLTAFTDETVRGAAVSPRDGSVLICADHDGDEFHQLYLLDSERGWPEKLTDEPQVQHYVNGGAWAPDGTKFAYAANARKPSDMECWVRDAASGESRPVFGEEMFSFPGPWSPDGTKLLAIEARNNSDTSIHLVDVEGGGSRELTPHDEDGIFAPGPWTRDGTGFYMVADAGSEFRGLALYDLASDRYEWVEEPTQDVDDVTISDDGRVLAWIVNDKGYDRLRLRDLDTGEDLPQPELPGGARPHLTGAEPPLALSPDGSHAALIVSSPRRPPEAWVVETATGARTSGHRQPDRRPQGGGSRRRRARELSDLRRPRDSGLALPARRRRQGSGRRFDPRRPGGAGAAGLPAAVPVPPVARHRRARDEHPRLDRLRQVVPAARAARLGRRRHAGLGARGQVAARTGLGGARQDRRLRRLVRRLRRADVRDSPAAVLGGCGRHLRSVEPGHVREGSASDVEAVHRALRR